MRRVTLTIGGDRFEENRSTTPAMVATCVAPPPLPRTAARLGSAAAEHLKSMVAAPPLLLRVAEPPALRAKEPAREW